MVPYCVCRKFPHALVDVWEEQNLFSYEGQTSVAKRKRRVTGDEASRLSPPAAPQTQQRQEILFVGFGSL
jgi:hypothetical protein